MVQLTGVLDPTLLFVVQTLGVVVFKAYSEGGSPNVVKFFMDPGTVAFFALWAVSYCWGVFGGKQAKLQPWEQRAASWYLYNGVFFHFFCDGMAGGLGLCGILGELYKFLDKRVVTGDPGIQTVLCVELFIMLPLCLLTFRAIRQGLPSKHALQICTCTFHVFGTIQFVASEAIFDRCKNVPTLEPFGGAEAPHWCGKGMIWPPTENQLIYFWFGFVFANIPWIFLPARLLLLAVRGATQDAELAAKAKNGQNGKKSK